MKIKEESLAVIEILAIVATGYKIYEFIREKDLNVPSMIFLACSVVVFIALTFFYPDAFFRKIFRWGIYFFRKLRRLFDGQPFVNWFLDLETVRMHMYGVWRNHEHLSFVGTAQSSLAVYFNEALASGKKYPWEEINVFFSDELTGRRIEGENFFTKLKNSRQSIAEELTFSDRRHQIPNLKRINFWQYAAVVGFTGSFYKKKSTEDISQIYIVIPLPHRRGEPKTPLTFKLAIDEVEMGSESHTRAVDGFKRGFSTIETSSTNLGCISPNKWDLSAAEWDEFCKNSTVLKEQMAELIKLGGNQENKDLLEIGCGTGEISKLLLQAMPASLMLLDASPQMLRVAKNKLSNDPRVKFALCKAPSVTRDDIDIENLKYDQIYVQQFFGKNNCNQQFVRDFSMWCKQKIKPNGEILVGVHNTTFLDLAYVTNSDLFRKNLHAILAHDKYKDSIKMEAESNATQDLFIKWFTDSGFEVQDKSLLKVPFSITDRKWMWRVPAVIDSLIDLNRVDLATAQNLIETAFNNLSTTELPMREVANFRFKLKI